MPIITVETTIKAPMARCFDLACSIDLHTITTANTHERAVAGKTSGLIGLGESVTWEAVHFGVRQRLTSKITAFERPLHFRDEQQQGAFTYFVHDHTFRQVGDSVVMQDRFEYESPFGVFGRIFNAVILTKYMTKLLVERNAIIKAYAETDKWQTVLAG